MTLDSRLTQSEVKTTSANLIVREANASDAQDLLAMMVQLALFEGYATNFRVGVEDLLARGLAPQLREPDRQFRAFVAASPNGSLLGYAVIYQVPFTYDLRPNLVLKELFVRETARGIGVGDRLMQAVLQHGRAAGCARLKWDVLPSNLHAKTFYQKYGGAHDQAWENWHLLLD